MSDRVISVAVSSRCQAWSWRVVVSGQKRAKTVVTSMEEQEPTGPIPVQGHQYTPGWPHRTTSPQVAKSPKCGKAPESW
jgi:hypothetical protein